MATATGVMEIWNLVFMQYERDAKGVLTPLPRPSIDTGMGLERTASILQGVDTNYEIDLFEPIFEAIWKAAKVKPEERREHTNRTASQVIADHIRAATFMCFDGVVPSNEGRGYVLRKIVRRALRFGRKLGIEGLFFADLAPAVAQAMGDQYPELLGELGRIQKSLHREEQQFSQTLSTGLKHAGGQRRHRREPGGLRHLPPLRHLRLPRGPGGGLVPGAGHRRRTWTASSRS